MLFSLAFCSPRERQESRPHITSSYARYSSPQMSTNFDNIMRNERRDNAVTCELALLIVERHPFPPDLVYSSGCCDSDLRESSKLSLSTPYRNSRSLNDAVSKAERPRARRPGACRRALCIYGERVGLRERLFVTSLRFRYTLWKAPSGALNHRCEAS
jgi:hypothetical protein